MIVLGIDPGSRLTGFGVVRRRGSQLVALAAGRIAVAGERDLPARLAVLAREIEGLVERYAPDAVVLESLFHGVNSRSLIVLAQARGAILAAVGRRGLAATEYSPAEIKRAVTGNGRADKRQVAQMVGLLLGLDRRERATDATDALAAAICFAQRYRLDALRDTAETVPEAAAATPRDHA
ncbi:MAG TPA: crossover junction endodeoxyribonuclease RuvC [Thermoanaerobaculia bacterium]|nr:crossover junction endodeoxyribonuclease RuvC [Thermoanaerobaculia bacterium]